MSEEAIQSQGSPAPVSDTSPSQSFDNSPPQSSSPDGGYQRESAFDAFKSLPEFQGQDDVAIAQNLYQSMQQRQMAEHALRQYQEVMPYATEYLKNQQAFQEWRKSQQAQQAQANAPKPWWNPPEIKDTWKSFIVRDPETGREVIAPDAPFEAQAQIREYQNYTANFAKRLVTDPENTLKPFIEQVAQQKAQELVQQSLNQYQTSNYVQSLEQQNADWLYDGRGNVSREGQAIQAYIAQAAQIGINDPQARWNYATGMLERDLLNLRHSQMMSAYQAHPQQAAANYQYAPPQQMADPMVESNMQFLRERATRAPSRSGGASEPRAPRQKMTFGERLTNQFVKDGIA